MHDFIDILTDNYSNYEMDNSILGVLVYRG